MAAPAFSISPISSLQVLKWQPTAAEGFLLPAAGLSVIQPIAVGASPFVFTAPQDVLVLVGGGLITSYQYEGLFPPNAGGVFGNPPTPGTQFFMSFNSGNDFALGVFQGDELIVTYTLAPQMYYVH